MPASPRGSFALAQALVAGVCRIGEWAGAAIDPRALRLAQLITSMLLTACAAFEIWLGGRPTSFLLLGGALLMALAAWRRADVPAAVSTPEQRFDRHEGLQSEIVLQLAAQHGSERARQTAAQSLSGEAWGDLMARVSHDLRTPLNAVIGFSDVMGSELFGPVGDQRYRDYIAHIRDSGRELLKSAEDTLAITSLLGADRAGASDAINLETLTAEAARAAGAAFLDIEIDDCLDVIGEARGLRQALVNLISEGRLRSGTDGGLKISASCEDEFVIVQVTARAETVKAGSQEASLHVCMARVLLELQGARLIEIEKDGEWRAVTVVGRAAQQDFFAAGSVPMGWQPRRKLETHMPS